MAKIILHIDLNAFFVRCEELKDPKLINKPVIVGSSGRAGIVSTCSYKAREYGIHSGMPTFQATALCPNVIIKPVDFKFYQLMSNEFFMYLKSYSQIVEKASIDECYVDMSKVLYDVKDIDKYLLDMQQGLYKKTGLKCSIGVGPTRFLAKMASDYKKPMGITIIRKRDIETILYPLDIKEFYGIGKKTTPRLKGLGINTIGDLANKLINSPDEMKELFGKFYYDLLDMITGKSSDIVSTIQEDPKSIGHSTTLMRDSNILEEIIEPLKYVSMQVSKDAKKKRMVGKTIQLVIKESNFKVKNKSITLNEPTNEYNDIYLTALKLYEKNFQDIEIRLIGVTLQNLIDENNVKKEMTIFNYNDFDDSDDIQILIEKLNREFDKPVFKKASDVLKKGD